MTHHLIEVPNTDEGRALLAGLRKHLNRERFGRVRVRGRGPRAQHARADGASTARYFQDLPVRHAQRLAVYVDEHPQPYVPPAPDFTVERLRRNLQEYAGELLAVSKSANVYRAERDDACEREAALGFQYRNVPAWLVRLCDWIAARGQA